MAKNYELLEGFKAKVTLFSGGEVVLDMMKVTAREWKSLFDKSQNEVDEAAIIGKAAGMTADMIINLPQPDYRQLIEAMIVIASKPLENPT